MYDQITRLKTDISTLIEQTDKKIDILARVHLQELEELKSENEIIKQLTSLFKFHCNMCDYKSSEYTSLRCQKSKEHEFTQLLIQEINVLEKEMCKSCVLKMKVLC